MRHLILAFGVVVLGGAGCAFHDVPLDMPISGLATPLRGGNGRQVIVATAFGDQRQQPRRCGMQKNGYNMDTANAVCRVDPTTWMAQVLADELRASGFTVVAADAPHRPGALKVDGTLLQLFVEPIAGAFSVSCEADLQARLMVTSDTGLRAERTFFAKGVWKGFAGITGPFQVSLQRGTEDILGQMVEAIIEIMNRYPQLGARSHALRLAMLEVPCVR
jgi:hypothetical protein